MSEKYNNNIFTENKLHYIYGQYNRGIQCRIKEQKGVVVYKKNIDLGNLKPLLVDVHKSLGLVSVLIWHIWFCSKILEDSNDKGIAKERIQLMKEMVTLIDHLYYLIWHC